MDRKWMLLAALVCGLAALVILRIPPPRGSVFHGPPGSAASSQRDSASTITAATPTPRGQNPENPALAQPAEALDGDVFLMPGSRERMADFQSRSEPPDEDIRILDETIDRFRQIFGRNPDGGLNSEIVASLSGKNSKRLSVLPPDAGARNSDGELLDRWGTPYHFHPVSETVLEIMSAGPDARFWTPDDIGTLTPVETSIP